jgi:hypothetical protein
MSFAELTKLFPFCFLKFYGSRRPQFDQLVGLVPIVL